jgi:FkbM family methyltransferase
MKEYRKNMLPKGYILSYAQNREDIIINAFFPDIKKGFYIDVGANHPEDDSVSKLFYDKGWTGINIEPNISLHRLLESRRQNDTNLNLGVSDKKSELVFREYDNHGLSTFSQESKEENESKKAPGTQKFVDHVVAVYPLKSVIKKYCPAQTINFMKIDVEGYEYEVIKGNDWKQYRPELVCIEANHSQHDWPTILKSAGYELVFNDGINDYYLRHESAVRKKYFDYAESLILAGIIVGPGVAERIKAGEEDRYTTVIQKNKIKQLEAEIDSLQSETKEYKKNIVDRRFLLRRLIDTFRYPRN